MSKKLNLILLIDDDEPTNFLHKIIIEQHGCAQKIETVRSSMEALEFLKKRIDSSYPHPDLIFLDINMPMMDGWEFLEEYKKLQNDQKGRVVIVMLTTSLNPADKQKAEEFKEIDGFRNKPLTEEMLDDIMVDSFKD